MKWVLNNQKITSIPAPGIGSPENKVGRNILLLLASPDLKKTNYGSVKMYKKIKK